MLSSGRIWILASGCKYVIEAVCFFSTLRTMETTHSDQEAEGLEHAQQLQATGTGVSVLAEFSLKAAGRQNLLAMILPLTLFLLSSSIR